MARKPSPTSTHKKAVVLLVDRSTVAGYLNPSGLGRAEDAELLTREGEFQSLPLDKIKSIYFVKEFTESVEPERKSFFSRPKLDGLWVRLRFRDHDVLEGIVANDLLDLLDNGVRLTPPDLNGNTLWIFIPRAALSEIKVLGVVGIARRQPARAARAASAQPKLFEE
ncbi:MAG TPA: hypothetical protein VGT03_14350 [Candidatus Acidoferrales bacterium]|nr:hypothetical protein [Candidatus Acidoferrales bacterium]